MSAPFDDCRKRIERAEAHRETFAKIWNEFIAKEDGVYDVDLGIDPKGTCFIAVIPAPLPEGLSLELGEMLYQLRAALDGCIYEAAILESGKNPPPNEQKLEFPICISPKSFNDSSWKLGPLTQKRITLVEAVQPYNTPKLTPDDLPFNFNRSIGILNDWARKDRHRRLHVTGSFVVASAPMFRVPKGVTIRNVRLLPNGFFLEHENKIAIFEIDGYVEGMKIGANPNISVDVAVNEIPAPCSDRDTLGLRCIAMCNAVSVVVRSFEISFGLK